MSVRAYRVSDTESVGPSFNCWHDIAILDFLRKHKCQFKCDVAGAGVLKVRVSVLKSLLAEYPWQTGKDYRRDAIRADIASAGENASASIFYVCA